MTGDPLFEASAEIQVPEGVDRDELEDTLEAISEQLSVEIDLK